MEHLGQFCRRFRLVGYHDYRRTSQAEFDASVEHIVLPGIVLDPCGYPDGIAISGISSLSLTIPHRLSVPLSQALSFKNINGESIPGAPELTLIVAPFVDPWNMVSGTRSRFLLPIANTTFL